MKLSVDASHDPGRNSAESKTAAKAERRTARLEAALEAARHDVERRSARLGKAKAKAWRLEAALAETEGLPSAPELNGRRPADPVSPARTAPRRARRSQPHVAASADAGSNSVHLFVAIVSGHRLEPIYDEAAFLGLGAAVDAQGRLAAAKREQLTSTLARFAGIARDLGADSITFVATEPLRRAKDARKAADEVRSATGVPLDILTHDEEALLTLIGVTHGREAKPDLGVVDIGGGSSELVVIGADGRAVTHGVRLGSARLTASVVTQDPPTPSEVEALREAARRRLLTLPNADIGRLMAVGGTATNVVETRSGGGPRQGPDTRAPRRGDGSPHGGAGGVRGTPPRGQSAASPSPARRRRDPRSVPRSLRRPSAQGHRHRDPRGCGPGGQPRRLDLARRPRGPGPWLAPGRSRTMTDRRGGSEPPPILDRADYELEVEDTFAGPSLDERLWFPHHLAGWSSRAASAARYEVGGGLRLRIDADQPPWSPEFDGGIRASSLQTGVFSGPLGSTVGQVHFREGLVVREEQGSVALYTPQYGLFEVRYRAIDDPANMVALWMVGFGDMPTRSAEICVAEIFGRDVGSATARIGMGVHPFGDPAIRDEFALNPYPRTPLGR